jgi:hypothetical protein
VRIGSWALSAKSGSGCCKKGELHFVPRHPLARQQKHEHCQKHRNYRKSRFLCHHKTPHFFFLGYSPSSFPGKRISSKSLRDRLPFQFERFIHASGDFFMLFRQHYSMPAKNEEKKGHALESRFPVFFYNAME